MRKKKLITFREAEGHTLADFKRSAKKKKKTLSRYIRDARIHYDQVEDNWKQ